VLTLPPASPNATTRERFAGHASNASCHSCHQYLDPIGFGFEGYDATGHARSTENGRPIDASGALVGTDIDGPFTGALELGQQLAQSALARDCFAQQWFEYAAGQSIDDAPEQASCGLRAAVPAFIAGATPVRELMVELVRSELFVTRVRNP
jgi:hypothetical protein